MKASRYSLILWLITIATIFCAEYFVYTLLVIASFVLIAVSLFASIAFLCDNEQ